MLTCDVQSITISIDCSNTFSGTLWAHAWAGGGDTLTGENLYLLLHTGNLVDQTKRPKVDIIPPKKGVYLHHKIQKKTFYSDMT